MPSEQVALLKTICDNPADDTARLVYADWLQEQGGASNVARAEFIRLQIAEAANLITYLNRRSMTPAEFQLYKAHASQWFEEIPTFPGLLLHQTNYERGFLYELHAKSVRSFLKAAPELFARVPITDLRFEVTTTKTAGELARSPHLARIHHLDQLPNGWDDTILPEFASTPHLCNLRQLVLGDYKITSAGLRPFLANPSLIRLTKLLVLNCRSVGPGVVSALANCASAGVLEDVCLQSNGLGPEAAVDLPALVRCPKLQHLNVSTNGMLDEAAICLSGVSVTSSMAINLGGNQIADRGGEALLAGPFLRSPKITVNLRFNRFSEEMKAKLKEAFGDRVST